MLSVDELNVWFCTLSRTLSSGLAEGLEGGGETMVRGSQWEEARGGCEMRLTNEHVL